MKQKTTSKRNKKDKVKKKVQTKKKCLVRTSKEEIISKEELEKRGGITAGRTIFLTTYLKLSFDGHIHYRNSAKLIDLARFIYEKKLLYVSKQGGFKLMEINSINTELSALKKLVKKQHDKEKMEQRMEAEKFKSRYR